MKIFRSYGFWTAFAGAVVIFINALGELFGFKIESKLIENVIMALAGVLVALGVVSMGNKKEGISGETATEAESEKTQPTEEEQKQDLEQEKEQTDEEK